MFSYASKASVRLKTCTAEHSKAKQNIAELSFCSTLARKTSMLPIAVARWAPSEGVPQPSSATRNKSSALEKRPPWVWADGCRQWPRCLNKKTGGISDFSFFRLQTPAQYLFPRMYSTMPGDDSGKAATRRKVPTMPYIMPDGRPLSVFLSDSNLLKHRPEHYGGKRRGRRREIQSGGTQSGAHNAQYNLKARVHCDLTEAERAELAALEKVGQRRQRRYLNDKLLRDMAPTLTASDMESLFKPVPFGENQVSVFTLAADPAVAPLWDLFRSVDADKQDRVLIKWENHIQELKAGMEKRCSGEKVTSEVTRAARAWSAVGPQGRRALKHASRSTVEALEQRLIDVFYDTKVTNDSFTDDNFIELGNKEVVLDIESSFERLLTHSLATFHSLQSWSRDIGGGSRQVVVRRKAHDGNGMHDNRRMKEASCILCTDILWLLDESGIVDGTSPLRQIQDGLSKLHLATAEHV
jgi:hypothetical protein